MTFSLTAVFAISTSVGITSYFLEKKRCLNKYLGKNSSCKIYLFKFVAIPVSKVSSQIANTISYSTWGFELPLFRIFTKLQWFFCKSSPDFIYLFLVALTNPQHAKCSKMLFCMKARGKAHPRSGYWVRWDLGSCSAAGMSSIERNRQCQCRGSLSSCICFQSVKQYIDRYLAVKAQVLTCHTSRARILLDCTPMYSSLIRSALV